jgi:hypothetical protein
MDGDWLDRETHGTCDDGSENPPKHAPLEQGDDAPLVNAITAVVRDADAAFQKVGGSSRHWVRECFLPLLNSQGFKVVALGPPLASQPEGWQPIASAPKNWQSILCRAEDNEQFVAFWSEASQGWVLNGCLGSLANARQFIEWQPLPPPPAGEPQ